MASASLLAELQKLVFRIEHKSNVVGRLIVLVLKPELKKYLEVFLTSICILSKFSAFRAHYGRRQSILKIF